MRFGIIGRGFITERFQEAVAACPDCECSALYSRNPEHCQDYAAKHGLAQVYGDMAEFARSPHFDAVYIASPNSLHKEQSIALLRAGKHVLCEKPAATNSRELEEILACSAQTGALWMEAMRPTHSPALSAIRAQLPKLGPIRRVDFVFDQYSSRYDRFKAGTVENAFRPELSNGALMDIGVYCIHVLAALFGLPRRVSAMAHILPDSIDAMGCILCDYGDMLATVFYSKISDNARPSSIEGEQGTLLIDAMSKTKTVELILRDGQRQSILADEAENNMVYEIQNFMAYAAGARRKELEWHWEISRQSMALMDEVRWQQGIGFPADE